MKNTIVAIIFVVLQSKCIQAQFSSGNHFFIGDGATVSINGLVLKPSSNTTIWSNKILTRSSTPIAGSPTSSINRVYSFNEPINFSGTVGINYAISELNGNNESELQIAYFNLEESYVTTSGGQVIPADRFVSRIFTNQNFLKITATNGNSVLPVKLVAFAAKKLEHRAFLTWTTTEESNSDFFEVQSSADGKVWKVLGQVPAQGESNTSKNYSFTDHQPLAAVNLYRLKMMDKDGRFAFSKMNVLDFTDALSLSVYPNPFIENLSIQADDWGSIKTVEIISQGKAVIMQESGNGSDLKTREFNFKTYPSGSYYIKVTRQDGTIHTKQVVKL